MESKTSLPQQSGLKKQIIWLCIWCACFFIIGAGISYIAEGQDYLRWVRTDNPLNRSELDSLSWSAFWMGGLMVAPFGVLGWGLAYILLRLQKDWWKERSRQKEP